jgi:hypothetical protein
MACELLAWIPDARPGGKARRGNPNGCGAPVLRRRALIRGARRLRRIAATWPWATQITAAITQLHTRPADQPKYPCKKDNHQAHGTPPTRRDSQAARTPAR